MTQTVVITGASGGIGRATAQLFGRRGANVALLARGAAGLEGAARDVEAGGGKARPFPPTYRTMRPSPPRPIRPRKRLVPSTPGSTSRSRPCSRRSLRSPPRNSNGLPRCPTSDMCTAPWWRWRRCGPAIAAPSCRSALRSANGPSRCSRPTAALNTPSTVSPNRYVANCCTRVRRCGSPWCKCPRSIRRSFPGCCRDCPAIPSRYHRSTSRRSPRAACCTPRITLSANSIGSVKAPWSRWSRRSSSRRCWTGIWPAPDTNRSKPKSG